MFRGGLSRVKLAATVARKGFPERLLYFGVAPGDDLLCSVVLRELRKRDHRRVWMMSRFPELFKGINDAAKVVPIDDLYQRFTHRVGGDFRRLVYAEFDPVTDRSDPPSRHIITELCARAGVSGKITIRPYINLTDSEIDEGRWASGKIAIQSSGLAGTHPMANKQWLPDRYQTVVDALKDRYEFIQIGSASDPKLERVRDLRGQTKIRETAAVLAHARLYIGNVGFLMHLARAVECPSVIVYGGREAPWQSGYTCNTNLHGAMPCAPCWQWNRCDFDRECMRQIQAADVVQAVITMMDRPRNPLTVDMAEI